MRLLLHHVLKLVGQVAKSLHVFHLFGHGFLKFLHGVVPGFAHELFELSFVGKKIWINLAGQKLLRAAYRDFYLAPTRRAFDVDLGKLILNHFRFFTKIFDLLELIEHSADDCTKRVKRLEGVGVGEWRASSIRRRKGHAGRARNKSGHTIF